MGSPLIGLAKDALLLNLGRSLPFRVTMMVSERCPLRCTTCSIWQRAEPREPSIDDVDAFLSANRKISWLNLTGGEIFLRGDMVEIFRLVAMRLKGLALLNFPTAGQDPHGIAGQVEAGLATGLRRIVATVSFDGGPTSHDRLRGAAGAFDRAAETWRSLKRIAAGAGGRLSVFAGMTLSEELMPLTSDPLGELIAELGLAGSHEIHLNLAHGSKHYYRNLPAARLRLDAIEGRVTNEPVPYVRVTVQASTRPFNEPSMYPKRFAVYSVVVSRPSGKNHATPFSLRRGVERVEVVLDET